MRALKIEYHPLPMLQLTEDQTATCIEMAATGKSFDHMAEYLGISKSSFYNYRKRYPQFEVSLHNHREDSTHPIVDNILDVVTTHPDPKTARNILEATKWVASMKNRKDYGSRMDINVHKTVDLTMEINAAFERTAQLRDITLQNQIQSSGLEPDSDAETRKRIAFEELL